MTNNYLIQNLYSDKKVLSITHFSMIYIICVQMICCLLSTPTHLFPAAATGFIGSIFLRIQTGRLQRIVFFKLESKNFLLKVYSGFDCNNSPKNRLYHVRQIQSPSRTGDGLSLPVLVVGPESSTLSYLSG